MTGSAVRRRLAVVAQFALALTLVAGLASCVSIPDNGPASRVDAEDGLGQSTVRYSPAPPAEGASPEQIARGFLDAMLAYPVSPRTAAAFLTPQAAKRWRPAGGVTIYRSERVAEARPPGADQDDARRTQRAVTASLVETGRLDGQGKYSVGRGDQALRLPMKRINGQWRISDPPAGLMVTERFFNDYFRAFDIYFYDRPGERLTAVPVHIAVDQGLAAALMASLLKGPGESHLRTALPKTSTQPPTVPIEDNTVDIELPDDLDDEQLDRMAPQIGWTLRQVPALESMRLRSGEQHSSIRGRQATQPVNGWVEFDSSKDRLQGYAVVGGKIQQLKAGELSAVESPGLRTPRGMVAAAVSKSSLALLSSNRAVVRVAKRVGRVGAVVRGTRFIDPVVDGDGSFWLVDRPGRTTRLRQVVGDEITQIPIGDLAGMQVTSFDVSPDRSRYVVTTGQGSRARIRVGSIERAPDDRVQQLGSPSVVDVAAKAVRAATWLDGVRVAFLGRTDAGIEVRHAMIDGSSASRSDQANAAPLPNIALRRMAISQPTRSDSDRYVISARGSLWYQGVDGNWDGIDTDEPVTGISFGQ